MPSDTFEVEIEGYEVESAADWVRGAAAGAATGRAVAGPWGAAVGAVAGGARAAYRDGAFAKPATSSGRDRALRELAELLPVVQRLVATATGGAAKASRIVEEAADDPDDWAAVAGDPDFEDD